MATVFSHEALLLFSKNYNSQNLRTLSGSWTGGAYRLTCGITSQTLGRAQGTPRKERRKDCRILRGGGHHENTAGRSWSLHGFVGLHAPWGLCELLVSQSPQVHPIF